MTRKNTENHDPSENDMTRRTFLGSLLGLFVFTQLPWIARLAQQRSQPILTPTDEDGAFGYALSQFETVLLVRPWPHTNGTPLLKIVGPGLKQIEFIKRRSCHVVHYQPAVMDQRLEIIGSRLIVPRGFRTCPMLFQKGPVILRPGDPLAIHQEITWNGPTRRKSLVHFPGDPPTPDEEFEERVPEGPTVISRKLWTSRG